MTEADPYPLGPAVETGVVFVHVPKTGGTSVARALYGTDGGGHRTVRDYRAALGDAFVDRAFVFAVVRDPVERLASAFRYLRAGGGNRLDAAFGDRVLSRYGTLDAFVRGWLGPETVREQVHFRPQADFVTDANGALDIDLVARHERLAEDYHAVRRRTGRGGPLPHLNRTVGGASAAPPRPAPDLSAEGRARVRSLYRADFALFGYPAP